MPIAYINGLVLSLERNGNASDGLNVMPTRDTSMAALLSYERSNPCTCRYRCYNE